jgi:tyrosinase
MKNWNHLPAGNLHQDGFTSIKLPEEAIKEELELLPGILDSELSIEVKNLRETALSDIESTTLRIRKNQAEFSEEQKEAFKRSVEKLVSDGAYSSLVLVHTNMSHNMHGSMGTIGLLRFLGWHRSYLMQFENLLIAADQDLRPNANDRIFLPYWHWDDDFPNWLEGFLPSRHPGNGSILSNRKNVYPPEKPTATDIDLIMNNFRDQLPTTNISDPNVADYVRFTYALEGWGTRPDETSLPAHNHVHDWVGGIMANPRFSPTDPVFWLHHAEVDRLWSKWQITYPKAHPPLSGLDRIFTPWNSSYDTVKSVELMGYTYGG